MQKISLIIKTPITFNEIFEVTSVLFFIQVVNYTILQLRCCIDSFYIDVILTQNKITVLLQFLVKNL